LAGATDGEAYRRLEHEARMLPAGSEGLLVFDAWRGNRTPYFDPQARGIIFGLTLEHTPAHLYRAVLEGCALGIRNVFETLVHGGCPVQEVRACGTGAGNRLWAEIIASVTQMPILVSEEKQATCLGSAVCAAVACEAHANLCAAAGAMAPAFETIDPQPNHAVYDAVFAAYRDLYANTKGTMTRLSEAVQESVP
jgi:ribulose kinase